MKALIFNSGLGSRMGELVENKHKCLLKLNNGETILHRQIRLLSECGIKEFIITTGPFKDQVVSETMTFKDLKFTFVENKEYKNTNYIVSMNYAKEYLDDDCLLLHGDLVFNKNLVIKVLNSPEKNICLYHEDKELPEKDFKGRFLGNLLKEVSVSIFDENCYAFQPFYKLDRETLSIWNKEVENFVENGITKVYAEDALNKVTNRMSIVGMSYKEDYMDEIDNESDYKRVLDEIQYYDDREQVIEETNYYSRSLSKYIDRYEKIFLVCGKHLLNDVREELGEYHITYFSDFSPNPNYEDIKKGTKQFVAGKYQKIISIGGGSSIDVAKCIKIFSTLDGELDFLEQKYNYNDILHIAIPTTAGTGSESTKFAVIYYNGKKITIEHQTLLPQIVIMDDTWLETLPEYQRKSTMLDSLCQAIESFWSKKTTKHSIEYSKKSIEITLSNYCKYLHNHKESFKAMMEASNLSGKAINITKTTAPHSMSYILTTKYGISHGHAVACCLIPCWKKLYEMCEHREDVYIVLLELAQALGFEDIPSSINCIERLINDLNLPQIDIKKGDIDELVSSVNVERLNNNPIIFDNQILKELYYKISSNNGY